MRRFLLIFVGLLATSTPVWGQHSSALGEAQVIDKAMVEVVRKAEPAIASIFVSRSEDYRRLLKDGPPGDQPGKLGGFDREKARKVLATTIKEPGRLAAELRRLDLSDPEHVPESYASGVVISAEGLVLTNFHVVRDATKIYVRLPGDKGSYANIYAGDSRSDLAVLRLLDSSLTPLPFLRPNNSQVHKGQLILSLVNLFAPGFRDARPRAGWGMVSNLRQKNPKRPSWEDSAKVTLHDYGTLIQIDRNLPLGSSGGALLNLQGELVGIITSLAGVTGDGGGAYAVPLDTVMTRIVRVLEKGEEVEYGFLGVQFSPPDFPGVRQFPGGMGAQIRDVVPGCPAKNAGLSSMDTVLEVNGAPIRETDDLVLGISSALAGSTVRLKVQKRTGEMEEVPVVLAKAYQAGPFIASVKHPFVRGMRVDSTSLMARQGFTGEVPRGVLVREVEKGSPAEAAQLQDAVITQVDGQAVHTPAEFYDKAGKTGALKLTLAGSDEPVTLN
jgi:serine protease Do